MSLFNQFGPILTRNNKCIEKSVTILEPLTLATNHIPCQRMSSKHRLAERYIGHDKNVWVEFTKLAADYKALNLGQGMPDFCPPDHVIESLQHAASKADFSSSQYARAFGHPRLVEVLAKLFSPIIKHEINPLTDVLITVGAYGSLFNAIQGFVNPGDEVIIIEPYFDCYKPMVEIAGGKSVFIPLRATKNLHSDSQDTVTSNDFKLDPEELASLFNNKTKAIIVNNPNNPLGKIYSEDELLMISDLCKKWDVLVIADEVYEWMTYDKPMIKMASLPDMWERTLSISSAGKTFSATGFKLGWTIGPKHLIHPMTVAHQNSIYNCPTPIQLAVAEGLETELARFGQPDCYFQSLAAELQPKRDKMAAFLREAGMIPVLPEGGYFMIADYSLLEDKGFDGSPEEQKDVRFAKWMIKNKNIAAIPPSAFYSDDHKHLADDLIRFCFIKEENTLQKAVEIMKSWTK